jgi:hypothetical protein
MQRFRRHGWVEPDPFICVRRQAGTGVVAERSQYEGSGGTAKRSESGPWPELRNEANQVPDGSCGTKPLWGLGWGCKTKRIRRLAGIAERSQFADATPDMNPTFPVRAVGDAGRGGAGERAASFRFQSSTRVERGLRGGSGKSLKRLERFCAGWREPTTLWLTAEGSVAASHC